MTDPTPPAAPESRYGAAARLFPFLRWLPLVGKGTLRADALAGLTGAIVVLPQAVAFATIAGLPPEYGLYAAMVPAIVAALFGSSWHLVSGPTTAISVVVFATISPLADPGSQDYVRLALTLTFLIGLTQLAMGLARMGALVNFISHTVVIGFTAGAALLIAASQVKHFFGIEVPRGAHFHEILRELAIQTDQVQPYVLLVGVATLAIGIAFRRFLPKFPYMIAAMAGGGLLAWLLNEWVGPEHTHISTLGALTAGLPALSAPDLHLGTIRQLASGAVAVSILGLTEAVSIARAIASRSEQRIDGNQEFIGQGLSNIAGSFFSAYASSGSFNRSGLNYEAGAKTPLASVFAAGFLLAIVLLVAPLAAYLPVASMAAILFLVAWGLVDFHHIGSILKVSRSESAVLAVTFFSAVFVELEFAIYAGVMLSLMLYLNRTSRPAVLDVKPDPGEGAYHFSALTGLPDCPQLKMVRVNGSLFFGAVDHVQGALHQIDEHNPGQKHVLIVSSGINFVDVAGAEMLAREARRRRRLGGGLYFYRLKHASREFLERGDFIEEIGAENLYPVRADVIGEIYRRLDPEICRGCSARIFRHCRDTLPDGTPRKDAQAG
ncbi:MAG TPA: SulP family inorganic anion transporter [Burkholderiales bacterium]